MVIPSLVIATAKPLASLSDAKSGRGVRCGKCGRSSEVTEYRLPKSA
ncbi:MAG TPA: hypothetical protein VK681_39220 [Reyranella sp.]|nr:hypothetical protein [Reyranella sp.]